MKKTVPIIVISVLALSLLLSTCELQSGDDDDKDIDVTFNTITANGSETETTTTLTLTFSQVITGLTAGDISLSGVSGVNKGTFSGSGPSYTLQVNGFSSGGTLSVAVTKSGYAISGSPRTVSIYSIGENTPVTFTALTANGSAAETTTALTLTFNAAITDLAAADITLSGVDGVTKGTLSDSGPTYTLAIYGFSAGGTLSVTVAKAGYAISGSPMTVSIYYNNKDPDPICECNPKNHLGVGETCTAAACEAKGTAGCDCGLQNYNTGTIFTIPVYRKGVVSDMAAAVGKLEACWADGVLNEMEKEKLENDMKEIRIMEYMEDMEDNELYIYVAGSVDIEGGSHNTEYSHFMEMELGEHYEGNPWKDLIVKLQEHGASYDVVKGYGAIKIFV